MNLAWEPATVGYETTDPESLETQTRESTMENLVRQQPSVLLQGLVGRLRPLLVIKDFLAKADASRDPEPRHDRYPDLIVLDEAGGVYVIECKLAGNAQSTGYVLQQVREYGERLRRLDYFQLNRRYRKMTRKGRPPAEDLSELMHEAVSDPNSLLTATDRAGWSRSSWEQNVTRNLAAKEVRLAVAVDQLHEELRVLLGTMNANLSDNSYDTVWAIELLRIEHGDTEFLIPEVSIPRTATRLMPTTLEETMRFASAAGRAVHGRVVIWAAAKGLAKKPTTPISYQVVAPDGERLLTLYLKDKTSKLELNLEPLGLPDRDALRRKIEALFGPVAATYPNLDFDDVDRNWEGFVSVLDEFEVRRRVPQV